MSNPMFATISTYLDQCVERLAGIQTRIDNLKENGLDTDTKALSLKSRAEKDELILSALHVNLGISRIVDSKSLPAHEKIIRNSTDFYSSILKNVGENNRGYYQIDTRAGTVTLSGLPTDLSYYSIVYEDTFDNFDKNPLVIYAGDIVDGDGNGIIYPDVDQGKTGRLTINKRGAKGMLVPFQTSVIGDEENKFYWLHYELDSFEMTGSVHFSTYAHKNEDVDQYFVEHYDGSIFAFGKDERDGLRRPLPRGIPSHKMRDIKAMIVSGINEQLSDSMIIAPDRALKNAENTLIDLTMPLAANVDRVSDVNVTRISNTGYLYSILYATTDATNPWKIAVFMLDTVDMTRRGVSSVISIFSPAAGLNSSTSNASIKTVGTLVKPDETRVDYILYMTADGESPYVKTVSIDVVLDVTGAPTTITNTGVSIAIENKSGVDTPLYGQVVLVGQIQTNNGSNAAYELIGISSLGNSTTSVITITDSYASYSLPSGSYGTRDMQFGDITDSAPVLDDAKGHAMSGMDPNGYIYGYSKVNQTLLVRYPTRSNPDPAATINDVWYSAEQKVLTNTQANAKLFTGGGTDCIALAYQDGLRVYRYPIDLNPSDNLKYANQLDYGWKKTAFTSPIPGIRDVVFLTIPETRDSPVMFAAIGLSSILGYEKLYLCEVGTNEYYDQNQPEEAPIVILDAIDVIEGSMIRGQQYNKGGKPLVTVVHKDEQTLVTHVYQAYQSGGKYSWMMVF